MQARRARRTVIEPDGRTVVLTEEAWEHITQGHPGMARFESAVLATVSHPLHREPDIRPSRERYFSMGNGPRRWLRVVIDFSTDPAEVVTAFGQDNDP
jgi:hypothetical protein